MKNKIIIQSENEMKELFKKYYRQIFQDYVLHKEESRIKYKNKHGFIDIVLKHKNKKEYILIEFKFNKSDTGVIYQINRYYFYFKKNLLLSSKDVKKYIIDYDIDSNLQKLCKESNIFCLCLKEHPLFRNFTFNKNKSAESKLKTKMTLSMNKKITEDFKKLCEEEGWKFGKQLEKYMQQILRGGK